MNMRGGGAARRKLGGGVHPEGTKGVAEGFRMGHTILGKRYGKKTRRDRCKMVIFVQFLSVRRSNRIRVEDLGGWARSKWVGMDHRSTDPPHDHIGPLVGGPDQ